MTINEGYIGTVGADLRVTPSLIESKTDILNRAVKLTIVAIETLLHYKWIVEAASVSIATDVVRQFKPLNQLMSITAIVSLAERTHWDVKEQGRQYWLRLASKVALSATQVFECAKGLSTLNIIAAPVAELAKVNDYLALGGTVIDVGLKIIKLRSTRSRKDVVILRHEIAAGLSRSVLLAANIWAKHDFLLKPITAVSAFTGFYSAIHKARVAR